MTMDPKESPRNRDCDARRVSVATLGDMLASLQEAVVTENRDDRRALLKGVIGHLQDLLSNEPRA